LNVARFVPLEILEKDDELRGDKTCGEATSEHLIGNLAGD